VEPNWAHGAKIFVPLVAEDVPEDTMLRHWHVLVYDDDVPRVHQALQIIRCKERPSCKSSQDLQSSADVESVDVDSEEVDVAPEIVVENTIFCVPEPDIFTLRSNYTYSCNDAIPGHINPRSKEHVVEKLKACHKRRDLPGAVQCYSSLRACGAADTYVFTILIDLCGKAAEFEEAETWAQKMFDAGFIPSVVTFNCLIGCCAKAGNVAKANEWFASMHAHGVEPEYPTYKCMILLYVEKEDLDQAISWYGLAASKFPKLDIKTIMMMMSLYGGKALPEKAEECLEDMRRHGHKVTRQAFQGVMSAYANAGDLAGAKHWLRQAKEAGFAPTVVEHTHLLAACGPKPGQTADPDQGRDIFLYQVAKGIEPDRDNLDALSDALGYRPARRLCEELHIHTRAARLEWWPDAHHFMKPPRLAREILGDKFDSSVC